MILVGLGAVLPQFWIHKTKTIMKKHILFFIALALFSCTEAQDAHQEPTHNFTVHRLIVLNDKNEILMGKEEGNWYTFGHVYNESQYIKECLDSLANEYGFKISAPQLRGYFSYKYEYHPHSTLRAFYVAKYVGGDVKPAGATDEMRWMPMKEAIDKIPVESIKLATQQIFDFPNTVWGGSFLVYRKGEEHHTRTVEDFYPLFTTN